ncbi:hypothetical protein AM228_12990 [Planktothricoides sp. SR001]|nr:hypothetical protein AM228_12990 [Planktothricoides sp. SR001]
MIDRGEYNLNDQIINPNEKHKTIDIRHLFYNHEINEKSKISVVASKNNPKNKLVVFVKQSKRFYHKQNTKKHHQIFNYF